VPAVVEHIAAPVRVITLAGVGVLVQVGAVEEAEAVLVGGEVAGHQSRMTAMPCLCRVSIRYIRSCGVPYRLVGAKYPVTWYPQTGVVRVLGDRHQFDVRESRAR